MSRFRAKDKKHADSNELGVFEHKDAVFLSNTEEKETIPNTSIILPFDDVTSILWQGIIFENIQSLRHFYDSKHFVDHVLKTTELHIINEYFTDHVLNYSPQSHPIRRHRSFCDATTSKHQDLQQSKELVTQNNDCSPHQIKRSSFPSIWNLNKHRTITDEFIHKFFFTPGFELLAGQIPSDWTDNPNTALFTQVLIPKNDQDKNTQSLHNFAKELNHLWTILYREVNRNVSTQSYRYSFIPLKHPNIFVPGGRFREIYYWDTFWIIQGLLCCGMVESSIKMVENLADLANRIM